ncbi:hypothetical protein N9904_03705 [Akkermansiaceae bacterium]|nr:hypothetical protein [Akkermansiaceae bacterium]MDB4692720.1 hypothetical protein [Akkermansiaceae bacterium]
MARRRNSSSDEGVNLDSLMDALTNVVAVLILVLLLVQADVAQKVVQFLEGLKPATPEQIVEAKETIEELEKKQSRLDQLLSKEAPSQQQIEAEQRQLALLEKNRKERKDLLADLAELKKLAKKAEKERDDEAVKTEKVTAEIARLEALLDETPVLKVEPTIVGIPSSRLIPKNAEVYHALVFNDRVHFIDPITPLKLFEEEFKKAKRNFPNQRIKQRGSDRYIYEAPPILKHFESFDFENSRKQALKLIAYPTGTRMHIQVNPDLKEGGTSLEQLEKAEGTFPQILRKLRGDSSTVILFHVHPNSFNTYLQARRLTDKVGIAAGWEVKPWQSYAIRIDDVEIKRQQEPPPPKPSERPPNLPPKID